MRKNRLFILAGGTLGALSRFSIRNSNDWNSYGQIPFDTLFINITGSFMIGLILTLAVKLAIFDDKLRLGITVGFLSAFTTFSTFCKETVLLIEAGKVQAALFYITASLVLGLTAVYFGYLFALFLSGKLKRLNGGEIIAENNKEGDAA